MAHDRVRAVGLQQMTGEDVEADAVAASERPHRPRREERGRDAHAEADVAHDAVEIHGERLHICDEEGQPDKGRVVLDRPRRACDELVAALTANDPQRRGGEEDDVRR